MVEQKSGKGRPMSAELKEVIDRGKRALGELCMPVSQDELPT
jgi:hypothetical protein